MLGLTNPIAFRKEMAVFVGKGRPSTVIYLDISKASDAVPHSILAEKLGRYELDGWTTKSVGSLMGFLAQEACGQSFKI